MLVRRRKQTVYTLPVSRPLAEAYKRSYPRRRADGRGATSERTSYETTIMHNSYSCFPAKLPASARAFARRFSRPSDATPTASAAAAQPREAPQPSLSFFLAT